MGYIRLTDEDLGWQSGFIIGNFAAA